MNHQRVKKGIIFIIIFLSATLFLTRCKKEKEDQEEEKCCEGYTGAITDPSASSLVNKCHFIIKDSIIAWTARYQTYKYLICNDSLPGVNNVFRDSCSFNRCIIKAIICNDNCIGFRILFGMSPDKKVEIILVGIKPDYSTLYIKWPTECCGIPPPGPSFLEGGAEYAQWP
jgi:hypothetical protein